MSLSKKENEGPCEGPCRNCSHWRWLQLARGSQHLCETKMILMELEGVQLQLKYSRFSKSLFNFYALSTRAEQNDCWSDADRRSYSCIF